MFAASDARQSQTGKLAVLLALVCTGPTVAETDLVERWERSCRGAAYECHTVAGSGVHYFTTALIHSSTPTELGMIQRSTDIIELSGDLEGRVLYHPISEFDFVNARLTNTGQQVFSGTVLGSDPVLIYDDTFRFEVNLATMETVGEVNLMQPIGSGRTQCQLQVVGTGMTPDGDGMVDYTGICRIKQ